jgi:glyoxylase-like metal-dependent hydrolase (beta-lactamase superfamily II)
MCILIERVLNKPINSNSFVIYSHLNSSCIIIDPGSKDCEHLISFVKSKRLKPDYIFLTHEHFDHIWGVNILKDTFNVKILCSDICSNRIVNKKKNLSLFYDQIGFETYPADISVKEVYYFFKWNGIKVEVIKTPGHSDASICFIIENNLFSGDTIIKNKKTVIKLPTGNKLKLIESLSTIQKRFCIKKPIIYPGHGDPFQFEEIRNQEFI